MNNNEHKTSPHGGDSNHNVRSDDLVSDQPFVDTHIHLDLVLERSRMSWEAMKRILPANFQCCVAIFSDPASFSPSFASWPDHLKHSGIFGAFGMHPHNAQYYSDALEERIIECLQHEKAVALGEIGLDFQKNRSGKDIQKSVFRRQLRLAVACDKPVVIHSRRAEEDTVAMLKEELPKNHRIHIHCFNGSASYATQLMECFPNLFFGVTGCITFQNANELRRVVKDVIPIERLLLETDGPYMKPTHSTHPRDRCSHPGHIPIIALSIAKLKTLSLDKVLQQTRQNTTSISTCGKMYVF
eukprot:1011974_1